MLGEVTRMLVCRGTIGRGALRGARVEGILVAALTLHGGELEQEGVATASSGEVGRCRGIVRPEDGAARLEVQGGEQEGGEEEVRRALCGGGRSLRRASRLSGWGEGVDERWEDQNRIRRRWRGQKQKDWRRGWECKNAREP
jgi:hypothetical protein